MEYVCTPNNNSIIEGRFSYGCLTKGHSSILYKNGDYYDGPVIENGIREGKGTHHYYNGDIYEGTFINNKRIGKSKLQLNDGSEYYGQFIDDEVSGSGIFTDFQGNRFMTMGEDNDQKFTSNADNGYFN
jgi:hypothetical protein